jgi:DNA-binding CsgD family transcriptional regulator
VLARAGTDPAGAVQEAELALADPGCARRPGCALDALTTLVLAGELTTADRAAARLGHGDHQNGDHNDSEPQDAELLDRGTLIRARTARWRGDLDTAGELYEHLRRRPISLALRSVIVAETVELLVSRGQPAEASALLAGHDSDVRMVGRGQPAEASALLAEHDSDVRMVGRGQPAEASALLAEHDSDVRMVGRGQPAEASALLAEHDSDVRMVSRGQPAEASALLAEHDSDVCMVGRGQPAEASALLAQHSSDVRNGPELRCARGLLAMAAGNFRAALADHLAAGRQFAAQGVANPAVSPWRRRAAWCARAGGDAELAAELAREEHEAALAWGEPRVVGEALAGVALLAGDGHEIDLLGEAAELLEVGEAAIEAGEARYELGRWLLRSGQRAFARVQFTKAAAGFHGTGNRHRAARAEEALRGLDPRPGPALTPTELKVAFLALAHFRNQDIAAQQFLAVRTVEFHLSQVYRKLGVRGRDELRFHLLDPEWQPVG